MHNSLLCAAALLQAQLGERRIPLSAVDSDLVLSRTASPRAVNTGCVADRSGRFHVERYVHWRGSPTMSDPGATIGL